MPNVINAGGGGAVKSKYIPAYTPAADKAKKPDTNVQAQLDALWAAYQSQMRALTPAIGDIELNVTGANPAGKYPGTTWVRWGHGRAVVGVDEGQGEFYYPEAAGGAKYHTLTMAEIPNHGHTGLYWAGRFISPNGAGQQNRINGTDASTGSNTDNAYWTTGGCGAGNGAHNNLQPYITCYLWKRIA